MQELVIVVLFPEKLGKTNIHFLIKKRISGISL
jgi:hypothetical protein